MKGLGTSRASHLIKSQLCTTGEHSLLVLQNRRSLDLFKCSDIPLTRCSKSKHTLFQSSVSECHMTIKHCTHLQWTELLQSLPSKRRIRRSQTEIFLRSFHLLRFLSRRSNVMSFKPISGNSRTQSELRRETLQKL